MFDQRVPIRVLLASTGMLTLLGLRQLIAHVSGMDVAAETSCRHSLDQTIRQHRPDLLVIDSEMLPHVGALSDLSRIRVLLLSTRTHSGLLPAKLSVCGAISERDELSKISGALETVASCAGPSGSRACCKNCPLPASFTPVQTLPLSQRESQVFTLLGEGKGSKDIAAILMRSIKTIEAHRENIKRKLDLANAGELIDAARRWVRGEFIEVPSAQAGSDTPHANELRSA